MRIHYFCADHWTEFPHEEPEQMTVQRSCCFCEKPAINRARTSEFSGCEPGHLPRGRFEALWDKAAAAAVADADKIAAEESPLYGLARKPDE